MEEPGGLPSKGSHRVGLKRLTAAAAAVVVQSLRLFDSATPWTAARQAMD